MGQEQYGAKLSSSEVATKQPEFSYQNERFEKILVHQGELISQIENKVHDILNRRNMDKADPSSVKEMKDFVSSLGDKINSVELYNDRLNKILNHLREII